MHFCQTILWIHLCLILFRYTKLIGAISIRSSRRQPDKSSARVRDATHKVASTAFHLCIRGRRQEIYRQRARIPEHAAGWTDRLFARPAEFEGLPVARSARSCWIDWHTERLTAHDGLIRANHPLVVASLNRRQSATSLTKLLRDPLGYLWTYGFRWQEPDETEEPLQLDALAIGGILHATLERAVSGLELAKPGGFGTADDASIADAVGKALDAVAREWERTRPVPPPVIWERKAARHSRACSCRLGIPGAIARGAAKLGRNTVRRR